MSTSSGTIGDFDFLIGAWTISNRRLKYRHVGSSEWDQFPSTSKCWKLLNGLANIDEINCSARGFKGMSVRTLDVSRKRWAIHWVNSTKGILEAPVYGEFTNGRGEFYGEDLDEGHYILCRFIWTVDADRPRWEQAFSIDRGAKWETNWIMAFTRQANRAERSATLCGGCEI